MVIVLFISIYIIVRYLFWYGYSVYAIYDSGVSTWLKPVYAKNNGEILRSFTEICNDSQSQFFKHPSDYTLFELGTFDDDSGVFTLHKVPNRLVMAQDLFRPPVGGAGGLPQERSEATGARLEG